MFSKLSNFLSTPVFDYFDWKNIKVVGYFSIFVNLALLSVPLYTLQVYDRVFASRNSDTLLYMSIGVIFLVILSYSVDAIKSYLLIRIGNDLDKKLSPVVLKKVLKHSSLSATTQPLRDIEKVKNFAAGPHGMALFFDLPWVFLFLFIVYFIHPVLSIVMAVNMLILFSLTVATDYFTSIHYNKASEISAKSLISADESVRNRSLINALGMRGDVIKRWLEFHFSGVNALTFASDYAVKFSEIAKTVRMLQTILMTGIGAYLAINNFITIGGMITASILAGKAAGPIEGLISSWKNLLSSKEAIKKLNTLLSIDDDKVLTKLPKPKGDVSVENLRYFEPKSKLEILKGLSFDINHGEIIGIVGPSSSGKTTLAKLLVGILEPSAGTLRIDGATLDQWSDDDRGHFMGYMPQEISLLSGTIKENIARFKDASDEKIIEAALLAGVHESILHLPNGYDTSLVASGENLSGGQRQRIALARAFFQKPSVVVLDEPNSFLDAEGEIALINAMNAMRENGSSVVVITHKPSIIKNADKLMVLNSGKIVAFGAYADVIKKIT